MHRPPLTVLQSLQVYALLAGILMGGLWVMDRSTDPERGAAVQPASGAAPADPGSWHGGAGRAFVLLVDSWRYETAMDASIMPAAAALRERGAHARMSTTRDAVTTPALRAAFTGREHFALFSFARNLWHREEGFESIFTQLDAAGRRVAIWSDGSFRQFGRSGLVEQRTNEIQDSSDPPGLWWLEAEVPRQNRAVEAALETFLEGSHDLVIVHVTYADHAGHRWGVHEADYRRMFGLVDGLIARLEQAIPPESAFLVMGDHGHDERGRHMMGLDVPTAIVVRGPGFRPGADLGEVAIHDTRYFLSWALKLDLPAGYGGGRHPAALVAPGAIPSGFERAADGSPGGSGRASPRGRFALMVLCLGVLAALWVRVVRLPSSPWLSAAAWLCLGIFVAGDAYVAGPPSCLALGALALARPVAGRRWTWREALWLVVPAAGVIACTQWGYVLSMLRPLVHYPRYVLWAPLLAALLAAGLPLAVFRGATLTTWLYWAIGSVALFPSVERYGAPATMAPVWGACLLYVAAENLYRAGRGAAAETSPGASGAGPRLRPHDLLLVPIALSLLPFGIVNAVPSRISSWAVCGGVSPVGAEPAEVLTPALAAAWAAKFLILVDWRCRWPARLCGAALAIVLCAVQTARIGGDPLAHERWFHAGGIAALTAAGILLRRWPGYSDGLHLGRIAWLGALYLLYYYTVRIPGPVYRWLDLLLAAAALSARLLDRDAIRRERPTLYLFLLLTGVWAAGWVTLAWTLRWFEWGFLYDWFDPALVEHHAAWFLVPIAARYALPLIMFRLVLGEALGTRWPYPQAGAILLAGIKVLSLLMIVIGIGAHDVASDVYLEAVQQAAIWIVVVWPLFLPGGVTVPAAPPRAG